MTEEETQKYKKFLQDELGKVKEDTDQKKKSFKWKNLTLPKSKVYLYIDSFRLVDSSCVSFIVGEIGGDSEEMLAQKIVAIEDLPHSGHRVI